MPGGWSYLWGDFWGDNLIPYVQNETVMQSRLDDAVRNHKFHSLLTGI